MANINVECGADIVVEATIGGFNVWHDGFVIANTSRNGKDIVIAGACARKMSVFDLDRNEFICGTLDQLIR